MSEEAATYRVNFQQHGGACCCSGPQEGDPVCPCRMRNVTIENGRYSTRCAASMITSPGAWYFSAISCAGSIGRNVRPRLSTIVSASIGSDPVKSTVPAPVPSTSIKRNRVSTFKPPDVSTVPVRVVLITVVVSVSICFKYIHAVLPVLRKEDLDLGKEIP